MCAFSIGINQCFYVRTQICFVDSNMPDNNFSFQLRFHPNSSNNHYTLVKKDNHSYFGCQNTIQKKCWFSQICCNVYPSYPGQLLSHERNNIPFDENQKIMSVGKCATTKISLSFSTGIPWRRAACLFPMLLNYFPLIQRRNLNSRYWNICYKTSIFISIIS